MTTYVLRRLLLGVVTVFAVTIVVFLLTHALGDPAAAVLGATAQQPEALAAKRTELGLDRSLWRQYWGWLGDLVTGDPGRSYTSGDPIGPQMSRAVGNSVVLMATALLVAIPVSVVIGVAAAVRRHRWFDSVTNYATLALVALPEFVIATGLLWLFSVGPWGVLPAVSSVRGEVRPWNDPDGLVLPTLAMALLAIPYLTRTIRTTMSEVLDRPFLADARVNGIPERTLVWRIAFPNALAPAIQVLALSIVYLVGGAVVIETVFDYPGIGTALVDAVASHNVPVVQFVTVCTAVLYVTCNLLADVVTVLVTPRLRTALR